MDVDIPVHAISPFLTVFAKRGRITTSFDRCLGVSRFPRSTRRCCIPKVLGCSLPLQPRLPRTFCQNECRSFHLRITWIHDNTFGLTVRDWKRLGIPCGVRAFLAGFPKTPVLGTSNDLFNCTLRKTSKECVGTLPWTEKFNGSPESLGSDCKRSGYGRARRARPPGPRPDGVQDCGLPGIDRPVSRAINLFCQSDAHHLQGDRNEYISFRGCKLAWEEWGSHGYYCLPSGLPIFHSTRELIGNTSQSRISARRRETGDPAVQGRPT